MNQQVYNPYLPLYEYVPDGEPYVFDERVYIYGSHDFAGGSKYCPGHYVTWSASVYDLKNWIYEGEIYSRTLDPSNREDHLQLWAPDVAKGADGRYYLFYCLSFLPEIGVAVANSPVGPFEFYGHIKYPVQIMEGKKLAEHLPFDPGVLVDDDGRVWLYYGFSPLTNIQLPDEDTLREMGKSEEEIKELLEMASRIDFDPSPGGMVVELESDMLTMKEEPKICIPGGKIAEGTGFEGHAFYEASSMRKVNGKYYYVYSSQLSHELCYAISDRPDSGFVYKGTIISNGDYGLNGVEQFTNMAGNNHGSIVLINEEWYVFYHRQTHGTESSRQGCAEKIQILPDGTVSQVEMTSCGLNDGPLIASGTYQTAIACHLTSSEGMGKVKYQDKASNALPYIVEDLTLEKEEEHEHYIANIFNEVTVGFKYFAFTKNEKIDIKIRGEFKGRISVFQEIKGRSCGELELDLLSKTWEKHTINVDIENKTSGLFFFFEGEGSLEFKEFTLL